MGVCLILCTIYPPYPLWLATMKEVMVLILAMAGIAAIETDTVALDMAPILQEILVFTMI